MTRLCVQKGRLAPRAGIEEQIARRRLLSVDVRGIVHLHEPGRDKGREDFLPAVRGPILVQHEVVEAQQVVILARVSWHDRWRRTVIQ